MERQCRHYFEDYGLETRVVRFHNIYGELGTYDGGREKSPAALSRKIAVAEDGDPVEISWASLRGQVGAFAATLRRLGVRPGDRVIGGITVIGLLP